MLWLLALAAASRPLVVDLIPLGFDTVLLEVRFAELWDVVDVFAVYEAPFTLTGRRKAAVFNATYFSAYMAKVVHLMDTEPPLLAARRRTLEAVRAELRDLAEDRAAVSVCLFVGGDEVQLLGRQLRRQLQLPDRRGVRRVWRHVDPDRLLLGGLPLRVRRRELRTAAKMDW